jgi:serine/threonine protein phosphatase Stp1
MIRRLRLEDEVGTHQGCVRAANEDSFVSRPRDGIWAVADGMGGHTNGQFASSVVAKAIAEAATHDTIEGTFEAVANAVYAANDEIFALAQARGEQMGTTVVALVFFEMEFAVLWAGDSRAYLYRDGDLHQLTRDHTQVQEMVDRGLLSKEEAEDHPMGHVLARAVGVQQAVEVDAIGDTARSGDVFLLCSDGLHGVLTNSEIVRIIDAPGGQSAEKLVEACLENGAPDNVTVTIVRAFEPTTVTFSSNQEVA